MVPNHLRRRARENWLDRGPTAHPFDTSCRGRGVANNYAWPVLEAVHHAYALRADGGLGEDEGEGDSRAYMNLQLVSIAHVRVRNSG
jgi:hypothetical protein